VTAFFKGAARLLPVKAKAWRSLGLIVDFGERGKKRSGTPLWGFLGQTKQGETLSRDNP
jgi:hypothetical protein